MPDLTLIHVQACLSLDGPRTYQLGSKPYHVTVSGDGLSDRCECPGYQFHGRCKHLDEARARSCFWSSEYGDVAQTPQQEMEMKCPKCGGDTRFERMAV